MTTADQSTDADLLAGPESTEVPLAPNSLRGYREFSLGSYDVLSWVADYQSAERMHLQNDEDFVGARQGEFHA